MERASRGTEQTHYVRIETAAELVGMRPARVRHYVRIGLVRPMTDERGTLLLAENELARLRKIRRLTNDLGLNLTGVELVMRLLDEIDALRANVDRAGLRRDAWAFGQLEPGPRQGPD